MVSELAQGARRALDGAGSRRHGDLVQVGGHRRCHLRRPLGDLVPAGDGGWPGHSLNTAVGDIGCSRSRPAPSRRNRDEGRCVDVAAFAEVLEEPAQLTDPVVDGAGRSGSSRPLVGMQRQPQAVVADVVPGDLGGRGAVRVDRGHVRGELSQRRGHHLHGRRRPRRAQLVEVGVDGRCQPGSAGDDLFPLADRRPLVVHDHRCRGGAHRGTPTNAWASIASAARRYSSANQSAPRCRYNWVEAIERCPAWACNASNDMPCSLSRVRQV